MSRRTETVLPILGQGRVIYVRGVQQHADGLAFSIAIDDEFPLLLSRAILVGIDQVSLGYSDE